MRVLLSLLILSALTVIGARGASLSGKVRDNVGSPLAGAQVTATSGKSQASTTTDNLGAYQFVSLPAGDYQLEASFSGFATSHSGVISLAATDVIMNIILSKSPAGHPQFEAAGVRGLIDPGGYSASANAAAATGLIKGIADIQRTENISADTNTSCALEPVLKREQQANPDSGPANLKLGEFYLDHGQLTKAIPALARARSLNNTDRETAEHLAEAYLRQGNFDAAGRLLQPEMHRLRARVDEGTGKFTDAASEYQLAASRDPSEENLYGVGYEFVLAGLPADAEQAFVAGLKRYPRSIQLLVGLGSTQFLEGHSSGSVQTLLRAVELDPADPRPYAFLAAASGAAHDQSGRVRTTLVHFHNIAPDDARSSYYLALDLLHDSNDPRVEVLLKRAIALDSGLADAHYQLGVLYDRQGNVQAAEQELETAVRLSPNLKEAHYRLALAYRKTGRMDLSAQEMQRFREAKEHSSNGDLDPFISVFAAPSSGKPCPGDSL